MKNYLIPIIALLFACNPPANKTVTNPVNQTVANYEDSVPIVMLRVNPVIEQLNLPSPVKAKANKPTATATATASVSAPIIIIKQQINLVRGIADSILTIVLSEEGNGYFDFAFWDDSMTAYTPPVTYKYWGSTFNVFNGTNYAAIRVQTRDCWQLLFPGWYNGLNDPTMRINGKMSNLVKLQRGKKYHFAIAESTFSGWVTQPDITLK